MTQPHCDKSSSPSNSSIGSSLTGTSFQQTNCKDSTIRVLLIIAVLLGVPMFMVWWQVSGVALATNNEEAHLHDPSHSTNTKNQGNHVVTMESESESVPLPVVSDHKVDPPPAESPNSLHVVQNHTTASQSPSMVWLMSFPNSGTSYTMRLVGTASLKAVATNYGAEFTDGPPHPNIPVYPSLLKQQGPYWRGGQDDHPLPSKYILTKTHCGSRCVRCSPKRYISTLSSFVHDCTAGTGCLETTSKHSEKTTCEWKETHYPAPPGNPHIAKMIHLIRSPFDNIVSRFHLSRKLWTKRLRDQPEELQEWLNRHPDNATGFANWCRELDQEYGSPLDGKKLRLSNLTCEGEWFKYVQWHSLAWGAIEKSGLPSLTLYYEDYEEPKWNATLATLLDFLELPLKGKKIREFASRPPYNEYYTDQQRREARAVVEKMAPDPVWELLSHYF